MSHALTSIDIHPHTQFVAYTVARLTRVESRMLQCERYIANNVSTGMVAEWHHKASSTGYNDVLTIVADMHVIIGQSVCAYP
jgi:hypothetical protein